MTHARISPAKISFGGAAGIQVPSGVLDVTTSDNAGVREIKRYTTIERMHGYVQLKPQEYNGKLYKHKPYGITYEQNNPVVAELKGTGGRCFRVHGDSGFTASAHTAMHELFGIVPQPSALFVLDW